MTDPTTTGGAGPEAATAAPPTAAPPTAGSTVAVSRLPQPEASLAGPLGAAGAALCVVLGLIWLAQKAVRLPGLANLPGFARIPGLARPLGAPGPLGVAAQASLDARRKLVLVACAGRQVLLLTGGPADLVVGWLPDAPRPPTDRPADLAAEAAR